MNKDEIFEDIQSFADDDADVVMENSGQILFTRNGKDVLIKIEEDHDSGGYFVQHEGIRTPYRKFIGRKLAKLELFANKLIEKRASVDLFIDTKAQLYNLGDIKENKSLKLLEDEVSRFQISGTKLTFITADAGHGKTVLLKKFQRHIAEKYLKNESKYLFWHVDLQGRELVRLNEAIMYDLGELRIPNLYYSSILTLIKRKFIVLAIDGFDELAAEVGGSIALGALSNLVAQMEGNGTLVAASRRTFFDTQDFVKRTKLLKGKISPDCNFHELKLLNWRKSEAIELISYYFDDKEKIYNDLLSELNGNESHPILSRPFLLSKVIESMAESNLSASEFIGSIETESDGVSVVVDAFTRREVDKWRSRDQLTGNPYLTFNQHVEFLTSIALEMWESKKDVIDVELVQYIATILSDQWELETKIRPMVINMVKTHALLIPKSDQYYQLRKFEHEEFKNYFLSIHLSKLLTNCCNEYSLNGIRKFLYQSQLPDSVAQYAQSKITKEEEKIKDIISSLTRLVNEEFKASYIQSNVGTIIPYLVHELDNQNIIHINAKINFLSLVFENKSIRKVIFEQCNFVNISFRDTKLNDCKFKNVTFNEIKIHIESGNIFNSVILENCNVSCISIIQEEKTIDTCYSPERIKETLESLGIKDSSSIHSKIEVKNHRFKKALIRFLNNYNRTTIQMKKNIEEAGYFSQEKKLILKEIIPLLTKHGIIEEIETKSSKLYNSTAWRLKNNLSEIFEADSNLIDDYSLHNFWEEVNNYEK